MVSITLDDRDAAILERLQEGDATVESLAEDVGCPPAYLRERLPELADNGLVRRTDGDDYVLTESGERAIQASPAGTMDDRIDTPEDVERCLDSFDLRADRAAAVRAAFAFLRYWGDGTTGEIVDAVYSEHPAGFESSGAWWTECVRDRLDALPHVESPDSTGKSPEGPTGEYWRYDGPPAAESGTEDGRVAPADDTLSPGSARLALERLDLSAAGRAAVRAAFDHLVRAGETSAGELESRIYPDVDAGYESAEAWWTDCVGPAFEALPGVEPSSDAGERWRHRQSPEGAMSSDPGAEAPDDPGGPPDSGEG